jgi:hypothetical protein
VGSAVSPPPQAAKAKEKTTNILKRIKNLRVFIVFLFLLGLFSILWVNIGDLKVAWTAYMNKFEQDFYKPFLHKLLGSLFLTSPPYLIILTLAALLSFLT